MPNTRQENTYILRSETTTCSGLGTEGYLTGLSGIYGEEEVDWSV